MEEEFLSCGIQQKKFVSHPEIVLHCIPQRKKTLPLCPRMEETFSVVSHNRKRLFLCIPQRKNPLPWYPTMAKKTLNLNNFAKINFSANDFNYESGSQEDQFDEKKWRPKISWYYPFK
jgi:hypothetical protein